MIEEDAKYYELGLVLGLFTRTEVIVWSDNLIKTIEKPSDNLIEISLSGQKSKNELCALLNRFDKVDKYKEISVSAFKRICSILRNRIDKKEMSFDEIAQKLYFVSKYPHILLPVDQEEFCNWVDDEFSLVRQGIKDRVSAEKKLYNLLVLMTII